MRLFKKYLGGASLIHKAINWNPNDDNSLIEATLNTLEKYNR
jgi:hypothetical protein